MDRAAVPTRPGRNGGRLLTGNRKAKGRPPSAVRAALRQSFDERVKVLEQIVDDPNALPQDRVRALDLMGKYGIGAVYELSIEQVQDKLRRTCDVLLRNLSPEDFARILPQVKAVWRD